MATLQEQLDEARQAFHDLNIGKAVRVFVDQNGERVEYTVANRGSLSAYISDLQRQINGGSHPGPMRVWA